MSVLANIYKSLFALKAHTHSDLAPINHTHSNLALSNHTHSEYALDGHTHPGLNPGYTSFTIGSNSGYYRKWENGDLEMYGSITISAEAAEKDFDTPCTVTFPTAFNSTTYFFDFVVCGRPYGKGDKSYHFVSNKATNSIGISDHDMALFGERGQPATVDWYAMGKWK